MTRVGQAVGAVGVGGSSLLSGLVSCYRFDEGAGSAVLDLFTQYPGSWAGTLGSQWAVGKLGGCASFNGTDNYVDLGTSAFNWGQSQEFSHSLWIKTTASAPAAYTGVWGKSQASGTSYPFAFFIKPTTNVPLFAINDGTHNPGAQGAAAINDGTWHHLVGVRGSGLVALYVDGVGAYVTDTTTGAISSAYHAFFGAYQASGGGAQATTFFTGQMDEALVWQRALLPAEVVALYNLGNGRAHPFA